MFDGVNFDYLIEEEVLNKANHELLSFQEQIFVKLLEGVKHNQVGYGVIQTENQEQRGVILFKDPDTNKQIILGYLPNQLRSV